MSGTLSQGNGRREPRIDGANPSHSTTWKRLRDLDRRCWKLKRLLGRLPFYRFCGEPTIPQATKQFQVADQLRRQTRYKLKLERSCVLDRNSKEKKIMETTLPITEDNVDIFHSSPLLSAKTKTGATKFWQQFAAANQAGQVVTYSQYWQVNREGVESQRQTSAPTIIVGKNIGRLNETTLSYQAIAEVNSAVQRKIDKGYVDPTEAPTDKKPLILPMLAHKYKERGKKLPWPAYVQPKLDGVRRLYETNQGGWSRQGKAELPQVTEHLQFNTMGHTTDGELMLPRDLGRFEETCAAVKKFRPNISPELRYYTYDMILTDHLEVPFWKRYEALKILHRHVPDKVLLVDTYLVQNEAEMMKLHEKFLEQDYEGTMVRGANSTYLIGNRSEFLLKVKDFFDDEFEIINFEQGTGKDVETPIFHCCTKDIFDADGKQLMWAGNVFGARPRGSLARRRQYWAERFDLLGKQLTVRYQNVTEPNGKIELGVPRCPVGIAIRDYE